MSLSVDGVWKTGVWAQTVWAAGVWREGAAAALPDNPLNFGLVAPPPMPSSPGLDFTMAPRDPMVDADFFAFARLAQVDAYLEEVQQWMGEQLGDGEEMADLNEAEGLDMDEALSGESKLRLRRRA
jgi:hypothetical protein